MPGSHKWPKYRKPQESECYQAVMPAGSCVIYTGQTFHSSAENRTEQPRWGTWLDLAGAPASRSYAKPHADATPLGSAGLNVDYLPAFVTEEELAILSAPKEAAQRMPAEVKHVFAGFRRCASECVVLTSVEMPRRVFLQVRRLMGYDVFGPRLGHFAGGQHPDVLLADPRPLDWAAGMSPAKM